MTFSSPVFVLFCFPAEWFKVITQHFLWEATLWVVVAGEPTQSVTGRTSFPSCLSGRRTCRCPWRWVASACQGKTDVRSPLWVEIECSRRSYASRHRNTINFLTDNLLTCFSSSYYSFMDIWRAQKNVVHKKLKMQYNRKSALNVDRSKERNAA